MRRLTRAAAFAGVAGAVIACVLVVRQSNTGVAIAPVGRALTGRSSPTRAALRVLSAGPHGDASRVALRPGSAGVIQRALAGEAVRVAAQYGTVQVAVWLPGSPAPLLAGQDLRLEMRLWSLSKPLVAFTLLRADATAGADDAGLAPYLERSLDRSDNCAQRYLTLRLQDATGGITSAALSLAQTLRSDGGELDVSHAQTDTLGSACVSSSYAGLPTSYVPRRALLVGTATWTITDAVRFARSLTVSTNAGTPAATASAKVLALMRHAKESSIEPGAGALTAPLDWGAGEAFSAPCWRVAWKAGWGGAAAHIPWLGSQLGVVTLPGGQPLAFAVAVHPYDQPPDDDPGLTTAPAGVTAMLSALRGALTSVGQSCS
ncbi:MAG TPA: hypothetical protein VIJ51_11260 [Solirubrobacteraceae bacterium]